MEPGTSAVCFSWQRLSGFSKLVEQHTTTLKAWMRERHFTFEGWQANKDGRGWDMHKCCRLWAQRVIGNACALLSALFKEPLAGTKGKKMWAASVFFGENERQDKLGKMVHCKRSFLVDTHKVANSLNSLRLTSMMLWDWRDVSFLSAGGVQCVFPWNREGALVKVSLNWYYWAERWEKSINLVSPFSWFCVKRTKVENGDRRGRGGWG